MCFLGCGNGMILIELSREGYTDLTGVDYSANAVELAQCIANDQNIQINYKVADLLADDIEHLGRFSVIHDKGRSSLFILLILYNLFIFFHQF